MATEGELDTTREHVQTYVPAYQKAEWQEHADDLDMSISEFVRTMVQAGRSEFDAPDLPTREPPSEEAGSRPSSPSNSGGSSLEDRVVDILSEYDCLDWDGLVEALTEDVEDRLEEALQELQASDRVRHSGRAGGYVLE